MKKPPFERGITENKKGLARMNRISKLAVAFSLLLTVLTLCVAADSAYSSVDDPLVSLSYVNDILAPEIVDRVMEKVEAEYVPLKDISSAVAGVYKPVSLRKGQALMADSCCEILLLDGSVTVIVTSAANVASGAGIHDLTAGSVITDGQSLPSNHYMVIPKADGRGITVSSDTANILVRGEYHITG